MKQSRFSDGRRVIGRRNLSLGLFGLFGRSEEVRAFENALRAFDLHPARVPDAVKLAAVKVIKDARGNHPSPSNYGEAACLIAYCALGRDGFIVANGEDTATVVDDRIEAALEAGEGLDASLILLAIEAGIIHAGVREAYRLESERGP